MRVIGIILWLVGLLWAIAQGFNIRQKAKNEQATEHTFELHAFLLAVSVIIIPVLSLSPFHLLWMLPTSFVLGIVSPIFPLNLLWMPASLYGSLWYIGIYDPARVCYLKGDYAKAIELCNETIRMKPATIESHFHLGLAYTKIGNKQKAIESFRKVVQLSPNNAVAYFNLGMNYKDLGDAAKAIISFKEAVRIMPDYIKARWNLGMAYVEIGDAKNALKVYEFIQEADRTHADELYAAIKKMRK